jgi:cyclopropane-fatty-acyl-phospholipid synthase
VLQARLEEENQGDVVKQMEHKQNFIAHLKSQPLALSTKEANEQHYEVPTAFYLKCLDQKYLK